MTTVITKRQISQYSNMQNAQSPQDGTVSCTT